MQVFGVIGSGSGRLVERLAGRIDDLAVVRGGSTDGGHTDGGHTDGGLSREQSEQTAPEQTGPDPVGATTYDLSDDGWTAAGDGLALDDVIDRLTPDHAYAVVVGVPDADLPQVVLGHEGEYDGETLSEASGADAVDLDELLARVDDLEPHETLESLVARVKRSPRAERAGAIATFTGRVRAKDAADDAPTQYLEFEKYEGAAERQMRAIEAELEDRAGVYEVAMHHRTGVVPDGEDIVFVVVLAGHRQEAFRTVEDGIDRLKDEVPLFKKEVTTDEEFWVHERD